MSGPGTTLFVVTSLFAVVGALITISARRPLRAAMGLLVHIVSLAGLFLTLNAHLLAALQLLVYAGAIVVLFVFVIMLIGPETETGSVEGMLVSRATAGALTTAIFLVVATSVASFDTPWVEVAEDFGTVEALGTAIYRQALVPFEVISITLLVAIVGAIAIARTRPE
ncbi:MAG: NADH-quinone oxidoreductase subunit J [Myxococcota bacterium]